MSLFLFCAIAQSQLINNIRNKKTWRSVKWFHIVKCALEQCVVNYRVTAYFNKKADFEVDLTMRIPAG